MDPNQITQNPVPAQPTSGLSTEAVRRDIADMNKEESEAEKPTEIVLTPPVQPEPSEATEVLSPPPPPEPEPPKMPEIAPLPPKIELPKPPKELPPQSATISQSTTIPPSKKILTPAPVHQGTSWGVIIGIVIIIFVLSVGALYFWGAKLAKEDAQKTEPTTSLEATLPADGTADITPSPETTGEKLPAVDTTSGFTPETSTEIGQ